MRPYFATLFRAKWLYMVALVLMLTGAVAGSYLMAGTKYEASARIWIDRPVLGNLVEGANQYGVNPAQTQGDILYQLIQTDSFLSSVIRATKGGSALTGRPSEDAPVIEAVRENLAYTVVGMNTVVLAFTSEDPVLCQQMVQATMDQYRKWVMESRTEQSTAQLAFFREQVEFYTGQMNAAKAKFDAFRAKNPDLRAPGGEYLNIELNRLQREYEGARDLVSTAQYKLDQATLVETLSTGGQQLDFRVLDKPTVPAEAASPLKAMMKLLILGVGASFGLVLTAVVLFTWMDRAVRTADDLAKLTDAPVLVSLPDLQAGERKRPRTREKRARGVPKGADLAGAEGR